MTISRAQALVLLEPKLSRIWFDAIQKRPVEWTRFVNIRSTRKATITDYNMTGFGPLQLKGEGQVISSDDPIFGNQKAYQPVRFAEKYAVTQEMIDHELYGQVSRLETALMDVAYDNLEVNTALLFNNAFGTTDANGFSSTGFDALQLCSTAHTRLDLGTNQRNRPSTDVDLSVSGLQGAISDFHGWLSHRGRPVMIRPQLLVVNTTDFFTAKELLQSEYKPGTANNEINAIRGEGIADYMISHYLTGTHDWFVLGDQHDLNFIWDVQTRGGMWEDDDSEVIYRKVVQGYIVGHGEWYGVWGSHGP